MKLEIDTAVEGLANPQLAALVVRTNLMSITRLSRDLPYDGSAELSMEDHFFFATLVAFSNAFSAVVEHHSYVSRTSNDLGESYFQVSERFSRGDLYNDPNAALANQYSGIAEEAATRIYSLQEYYFYEDHSPAQELAKMSAEAAGRLGTGVDLEKDARAAYDMAFQVWSNATLRKSFIADANELKTGIDVIELLNRPLFDQVSDASSMIEEWSELRQKLQNSSRADWDVWIGWIQNRIDGVPLNLDRMKKWASLSLSEYPQASVYNPLFAKA